jgi:hypothetical protein
LVERVVSVQPASSKSRRRLRPFHHPSAYALRASADSNPP